MRGMICAAIAVIAVGTLAGSSTVAAAELSIPIDTVITGGVAEGEQIELTVVSSGPLTGQTCTVRAIGGGADVHAGNDLIVSSGDGVATLMDVERAAGSVTEGDAPLTLGDVITVELRMGAAGEFGGDIDLELDCPDAAADTLGALPETGAPTTVALVLAILLIAAGGVLVWTSRRPDRIDPDGVR